MAERDPEDQPTRVGRPGVLDALHALLGAFPVAYFLLAFLTDLTYTNTYYFLWPIFSIWLIVAGLLSGGLAVLLGLVDWFVSRRYVRRGGTSWHALLTIVALLLGLLNAFIHSRDGWTAVVPEGIILSGLTAVLMLIAALLGAAHSRRMA